MNYFGEYLIILVRQEHKEGNSVLSTSSLPFTVLGSRGLVDTVPGLGTRGVGRQRSNPSKYLAKK